MGNFLLHLPSSAVGKESQASVQAAESAVHGWVFPGAIKLPLSPSDQVGNRVVQTPYRITGGSCRSWAGSGLRGPQMRNLHLSTRHYPSSGTNTQKKFEWSLSPGCLQLCVWESPTGWGPPGPFLYAEGPLLTITSAHRKQFSITVRTLRKKRKVALAKPDTLLSLSPSLHSCCTERLT